MQAIITNLAAMATAAGGKIILALLVLIIGNILIKSVLQFLGKSKMMDKIEGTVRTFILSFLKAGLYAMPCRSDGSQGSNDMDIESDDIKVSDSVTVLWEVR